MIPFWIRNPKRCVRAFKMRCMKRVNVINHHLNVFTWDPLFEYTSHRIEYFTFSHLEMLRSPVCTWFLCWKFSYFFLEYGEKATRNIELCQNFRDTFQCWMVSTAKNQFNALYERCDSAKIIKNHERERVYLSILVKTFPLWIKYRSWCHFSC